jgi:hypothetical protein
VILSISSVVNSATARLRRAEILMRAVPQNPLLKRNNQPPGHGWSQPQARVDQSQDNDQNFA